VSGSRSTVSSKQSTSTSCILPSIPSSSLFSPSRWNGKPRQAEARHAGKNATVFIWEGTLEGEHATDGILA